VESCASSSEPAREVRLREPGETGGLAGNRRGAPVMKRAKVSESLALARREGGRRAVWRADRGWGGPGCGAVAVAVSGCAVAVCGAVAVAVPGCAVAVCGAVAVAVSGWAVAVCGAVAVPLGAALARVAVAGADAVAVAVGVAVNESRSGSPNRSRHEHQPQSPEPLYRRSSNRSACPRPSPPNRSLRSRGRFR
jgi:hypothetical protein